MKIHELEIGAHKSRKRVGRGISAGGGKTAGRGTKGQNSRAGGGVRPGFAGGQNPLAKILPKKRGFQALSHTDYQVVNLGQLTDFKANANVDAKTLKEAGLVKKTNQPIKLLGNGSVSHALTIKVQAASGSAQAAIKKAGGKVELVGLTAKGKTKA